MSTNTTAHELESFFALHARAAVEQAELDKAQAQRYADAGAEAAKAYDDDGKLEDLVRMVANRVLPAVLYGKIPVAGWWDGRADFRTQYETANGQLMVRRGLYGGYGIVRVRHVPTGQCPSGPCGQAREVISAYVPDSAPAETIAYLKEVATHPAVLGGRVQSAA